MVDSQNGPVRFTLGLAVLLSLGQAAASDPWPEARPIATDTPAFRAPTEAPDDGVAPLVPEPAGPISLEDALALALMQSPELAAFSWDVRASEARELQAGRSPNPELDVRWRNQQIDDARRRVIVRQEFELGGKRRRRVDLAQTEKRLAGWEYEAKRIAVATTVADRFARVLGAQRQVASLGLFADYMAQMLADVTELVGSGVMRRVEIHQVGRRAGMARIELNSAQSELSAARFALAATWGGRSPRFTEAVGGLETAGTLPDIETVIGLAERGPTVARWEAELDRSKAELGLAKARRAPDLTYGVGVRWESSFDRRDYLIDFEISLPIFDRKQGEIREARYGMARARAAKQAAEAAGGEAIAQLYYRAEESDARRSTLRDEVLPAARATFDAFQVGFDKQIENVDDLIDARRDLARAEVDYWEALVDYHQALAGLEAAVGQSLR